MPTRFYLPSNVPGNYAFTATGWTATTGVVYRTMQTATQLNGQLSSYATNVITKSTATNPANLLAVQFQSRPMTAQTVAGGSFLKGILRVQEGATTADANAQVLVRIISQSGTVRGTLLALNAAALSNEFDGTTLTNRKFPVNWTGSGASLTSVAAQLGDILVVDLGGRFYTALTGGTNTGTFELGYSSLQPDLAENEVGTTAGNGWLEFSQNLTFIDDGFTTSVQPHAGTDGTIVFAGGVEVAGQGSYANPYGLGDRLSNSTGFTSRESFGSRGGVYDANSADPVGRGLYSNFYPLADRLNNSTGNSARDSFGSRGGLFQANDIDPVGFGSYTAEVGLGIKDEPSSITTGTFTVNAPRPLFDDADAAVVTYGLAAVDTGVGRRFWESTTVDFASAPAPVGSWVPSSLTIMYQR